MTLSRVLHARGRDPAVEHHGAPVAGVRGSPGAFPMALLCQMTLNPHKLDMEGETVQIQTLFFPPIRTCGVELAFGSFLFFLWVEYKSC